MVVSTSTSTPIPASYGGAKSWLDGRNHAGELADGWARVTLVNDANRHLWTLVEAVHSPVYFADEAFERYQQLGLKGRWMGYFATRSAPLGPVPAEVVTALFYGFAHRMVARALPDAWLYTTPERALAARYDSYAAIARRVLGERVGEDDVREAAGLLGRVVAEAPLHGNALFAAYAATKPPDEPVQRLFWAASALRELRGDAHVTALKAAGLDGAEANALMVALGRTPEFMQTWRGWDDAEWAAAYDRLRERGWVDADGAGTGGGQEARDRIDDDTDRIVGPAWAVLDDADLAQLRTTLTAMTEAYVEAGLLFFPSPTGVPRP
jgi:hypothetical protein